MYRKTFFKDRSKRLYFIKGRQLFSITESKTTTLFLFLEIKWEQIKDEYVKLNKYQKPHEKAAPVVFQFDYKTYKTLASGLTNDLYLPIGFGLNDVRVVFVERNAMKAITKHEDTEKDIPEKNNIPEFITVKKASELAEKCTATIRQWIKKGNIKAEKTKKGADFKYPYKVEDKSFSYIINKQSLIDYLNK